MFWREASGLGGGTRGGCRGDEFRAALRADTETVTWSTERSVRQRQESALMSATVVYIEHEMIDWIE